MLSKCKIQDWINDYIKTLGFKTMTEVQAKTIPLLLDRQNIIATSSTGSGKTLAFLIPTLNQIILNDNLQVLIITPTRELARQIWTTLGQFKKHQKSLKISLLIGGNEYQRQIDNIKKLQPQILVTTTQRVVDAIKLKDLQFNNLTHFIVDEADMLMDLGFINDLDFIIAQLNKKDLIMSAWSATLHEMLAIRLSKIFQNTKIVMIGKSIYENNKIKHKIIHSNDAYLALGTLLRKIDPYLCLIFANKKSEVEQIYNFVKKINNSTVMLHGDLSSRERKNVYLDIKNHRYQYVIASDLASRGLDIDGASHVISWNIAKDNEWYVHRAGRAGRGKYDGESWVICVNNDDSQFISLEAKGIHFNHYMIKNNELYEKQHHYKKRLKLLDENTNNAIKKIVNKKSAVKPNHKKKKQKAIQKIKQKSKRKYLEQKIKKDRINKYRSMNRNQE